MTGEDFKAVRALYGETQVKFARRCGWEGSDATLKQKVIRYERGDCPVVGPLAVLLQLLRKHRRKGDTHATRKPISPERRKQIGRQAGLARAASLSPERRREIASIAGKARAARMRERASQ